MSKRVIFIIPILLSMAACQAVQNSASKAFDNANSVVSSEPDQEKFWGHAPESEQPEPSPTPQVDDGSTLY